MDTRTIPYAIEPSAWYVVFHPTTKIRIVSLLSFGRFKHVSAFAYYAGFKGWLVIDPQIGRLSLSMIPHEKHQLLLDAIRDCTIVKCEPKTKFAVRFGFYCVPTIKYLLGLSCVAMRPDALYRHILKHGGILIDGQSSLTTSASARSLPAN